MKEKKRLIALDAFRGITIAAMIMVNQPGSWSFKYTQMRHAQWNGCTITDLIFPFFLIIVGIACWFVFDKYEQKLSLPLLKKIIHRTIVIFLIGLTLNLFKQYLTIEELNLSRLRISGVLQRIAFCYCIGSIICLSLNPKSLFLSSIAILILYWFVLWYYGGINPYSAENTIVGKIDIAIIGKNHLRQGFPVDTSSFFASIPAIINIIWGYLIGMIINKTNRRKSLILKMFFIGVPAILIGQIWNNIFPINKTLWTSSYVLFSSGWSLISLGLIIWFIDVKKNIKFFTPFLVFGINPLFAYVFSEVWGTIMSSFIKVQVGENLVSLKNFIYNDYLVPIAGNMNGSLIYSIIIMIFYWSLLWFLYKMKIFIKI